MTLRKCRHLHRMQLPEPCATAYVQTCSLCELLVPFSLSEVCCSRLRIATLVPSIIFTAGERGVCAATRVVLMGILRCVVLVNSCTNSFESATWALLQQSAAAQANTRERATSRICALVRSGKVLIDNALAPHAGRIALLWLCCAALTVCLVVLTYKAASHQLLVDRQISDKWDFYISRRKKWARQGHDCASAPVNTRDFIDALDASCALPRIFVMAARNNGQWDEHVASTWRGFDYTVVNTTLLSLRHSHVTPCLHVTWPSRLFEVYKSVFREMLAAHDDEGFVFVEVRRRNCAAKS